MSAEVVDRYELTAEDVARLLGVTARRVRQIEPGELPYLQLGLRGPRRYSAPDVDRYIALRRVGRVAR